mmetsp:Transcript_49988/g.125976  ORF Transcript_49988/g.125976 Transcript_49988/m.125976 type:complete len:216 (+) Transcript_49988:224-871(+)
MRRLSATRSQQLSKPNGSIFDGNKHPLNDLPFLGQLQHELEVGYQLVVGLVVPPQQLLGVVGCLVLQLVRVAIHGGPEAPGVLRQLDGAAGVFQHLGILRQRRDGRELHEAKEALRLLVGQTLPLDPICEQDLASWLDDACGLVDDELLVGQVAPSVLAVDEIGRRVREAALQGIRVDEGDLVAEALLRRALDARLHDLLGNVNPCHGVHPAQAH